MPDIISEMDPMDFASIDQDAQEQIKLLDSTTLAEVIQSFNDWAAAEREMNPGDFPYHDCLDAEQQKQVIDAAVTLMQRQRKDREQLLAQLWDQLDLKPLYKD